MNPEILTFAKIPTLQLVRTNPSFIKFKTNVLHMVNTYVPTGHPIDESQFYILFEAFLTYRTLFTADEVRRINTWILAIGRAQIRTFKVGLNTKNNWNSHRLKIVACAARVINSSELYTWAHTKFYEHIAINLLPDGSCYDWLERDSMSYVTYNLVAYLIAIKHLQIRYKDDYYNYISPTGSSIKKSIYWTFSYIEGTQTNIMFMKSSVASDTTKTGWGKPWSKDDAKPMLQLAIPYDPPLKAYYAAQYPLG